MTENVPSQSPMDQPAAGAEYRAPWQDRETRREERRARRAEGSNPWILGAILIALGILFMAQNLNVLTVNFNWWALFILIPAFGAFASAWRQYQLAGAWNAGARGSLIGGTVLTLVAATFMFNLSWGVVVPIFLILIGVGSLMTGLGR